MGRNEGPGAGTISVRGAREHNLRGLDVDLPRGALVVVTGVSGSGKSSLAFDTVGAEGRRRYLETFSSYARQFLGRLSRPAAAGIDGLSPAVAVEQGSGVRSPRSTVGTMTGIHDLLRLLFAREGVRPPGAEVPLERRLFSFNSPHGACPACRGLGVEDRLDPDLLVAHPERSIRRGALRITTPSGYLVYSQVTIDVLDQVCRAHGFDVDEPWSSLTDEQRGVVLQGSERIRIPYGKHPLSSRLRWSGITARPREEGVYKGILPIMEQILRQKRNRNILRFVRSLPCRACHGSRLRPEALAVTVRSRSIAEVSALPVDELPAFFDAPDELAAGSPRPAPVWEVVREAVRGRVAPLRRLGLGHLTLDRDATTLSAGEAQRLRLARLAGLELSGVLYVLDEPTVGLHPHDTGRLLEVLRRVRGRGNTVLVVEHDEATVRGADWVVDVGPGAGARGGELLFGGSVAAFLAPRAEEEDPGLARSRTRAFLTGRERVPVPSRRRPGTGALRARGLTRHNLRGVAVELRRGALNVVTGVSGAGKTTLVEEVVRRFREGELEGAEGLHAVVEVDQSPLGRTPRSNPATYTGLFDAVRDLFASSPEAKRRGLGKGAFSFNVRGGRCEACEGAGVVVVGLQFLGSASVVCEACGGRRFHEETLHVLHRGRSIADVLALSIEEAADFFAGEEEVARPLRALRDLGLGYLPLGHPATALSGGEAQRVKLAAELGRPGRRPTLYVLDEPTTGLHGADVVPLLAALDRLVERGHTVVAVEHHLDLVKVADWVVDLGPGSGAEGGRVVAAGPPEEVACAAASLTAPFLRRVLEGRPETSGEGAPAPPPEVVPPPLRLTGVTTHNLRGLDLALPAAALSVITGVSGSGKSSLAFDTLLAVARERFAEGLSTFARRFLERPGEAELEGASGLTPAIAVSQRAPSRNPRSTVGTMTELLDLYRLLYARAGTRRCPACAVDLAGGRCSACGFVGAEVLTASMFSPNSEVGACPACAGLGHRREVDPSRLVTDPSRPLPGGALAGHQTGRFYGDPHGQHMAILAAAGRTLGLDFSPPFGRLEEAAREVALRGAGERVFDVEWAYRRGSRTGVQSFRAPWPGLLELVRREYERKHADRRGEALEPLLHEVACPACRGAKLRPEALAVRFAGAGLHELCALTVSESRELFREIEAGRRAVGSRELELTRDLRREAAERLESLEAAGLGYLGIDRPASTLSGGEAQRVRLAAQLRCGLTGVTYVLDEPTIGLHPRDTSRLVALLRQLRDAGNAVVVVEHDRELIAAADHVVEIGPGAGPEGGRLVAEGTPAQLAGREGSRTGALLRRRPGGGFRRSPRPLRPGIGLRGATLHNLRGLDVDLPAGGLVGLVGVSGSGKSTLLFDVLAPSLEARLAGEAAPVGCREIVLHEPFAEVVRAEPPRVPSSPGSCPLTRLGAFDAVREVFARSPGARERGLGKAHFSLQSPGGRCEACQGQGRVRVSMDFLPDEWLPCEDCGGRRFGPEALACTVEGRSIADVLEMTGAEAAALFQDRPALRRPLGTLVEVGLGYLRLGQPARTLSGGERQRLELAAALLADGQGPRLYLFDEPTTGLHADDVERLLGVFDALVEAGHTLLAVEHDLDLVARADWVVELGPEGGPGGGRLVAEGPPSAIAAREESATGRALRGD